MKHYKPVGRSIGKITVSSVLMISMVIVLLGLAITQFFSFPDYEEQKKHDDLKYLAQIEGLSVDEYLEKENERVSFYADRKSTTEAITDAIHLNKMSELPAALNAVKEFHGDDYSNWPRVYSEAIKAKNMVAFKWFIKQKVPCDYRTSNLGGMAFYSAVEEREIEFFEALIQSGCDIKHGPRQDPIHDKIKRMKDQQWLDLLYSYYPIISLP